MEFLKRKFSLKDDIMADEESKMVRKSVRDSLDKMSTGVQRMAGTGSRKVLGHRDTMLPLNEPGDAWKTAGPVTDITESRYPFDNSEKRPTAKELDDVYKSALGVVLNPVNKEYQNELNLYTMKMFGKNKEGHEAMKADVAKSKMPTEYKLHLDLLDGKDLVARDANGLSDPYCYISVVDAKDVDMIVGSKHSLEEINKSKHLGLVLRKSTIVPKTLNPTWNQSFQLPLRKEFKTDVVIIDMWDSDSDPVELREVGLTKIVKFFRDDSDDDFMGRAYIPLSDISLTERPMTLKLYSRNKKKQYGEVRVQVSLAGNNINKSALDEATMLSEQSQLTAAVLDFESHMTGEYIKGWDTKITPLGYKLITLNATMNGLSQLQQAAVLFPLLLSYDKSINLSVVGYFGVIKVISSNQGQLSTGSASVDSNWAQTIVKCLDNLDGTLIGTLRKHHQFFSFQTAAGIDHLALHVELITEMYNIEPFVKSLIDSRKSLKDTLYDASVNACANWFNTLVAEAIPALPDDKLQLLGFVEVIRYVTKWLHNSTGAVQNVFQKVGVDYYTLLYIVVDKEISATVQDVTKSYQNGDAPSYQLYLQLSDILKLSVNIPQGYKSKLHLNGYHEWFTGLVAGWIDAAADKCNVEIKRAVTSLDDVATVTENVKFSHSALSAAACFERMAAFWNNLHWPKVSQRYSFIVKVIENLATATKYYVQESHKHLKTKGFYDDPKSEEFEITPQLCICLNDIEHVSEELLKIPVALQFDALISRLAEVEGDAPAAAARRTMEGLIKYANDDVMYHINQVVLSIADQMSKDVNIRVTTLLNAGHEADLFQALDPLMQYLSQCMQVFNACLSKSVLDNVVENIWSVALTSFVQAVEDPKLDPIVAKRLSSSLNELVSFFHAGGSGLSMEKLKNDKYTKMCEILDVKALTVDELIECHLQTLAKWTKAAKKENGQLSFSVGYIQDKETLEITVIKGTNLPVMDSNGLSDPYVEIVLMPESRFKIKPVKTDYKKKELNPFYAKDFNINVKEDLLNASGSALTLTVLDYDRYTKNDYSGMVVIGCEEIPRLPCGSSGIDDPSAPQRQNYELPLVFDTMTPALMELSRRKNHYVHDFNEWHSQRESFAESVLSKFSKSH